MLVGMAAQGYLRKLSHYLLCVIHFASRNQLDCSLPLFNLGTEINLAVNPTMHYFTHFANGRGIGGNHYFQG